MVESPKGCVLQWAGHAGYITERFSGLLARQALVDVTLVCEEQKLRVHKLVLASNSTYFEEILQQDLGEEPIILLKDLNFEILKAMVEFMYCGETTISHQLLPSLLTATKTFKVKELASVIDTMMTTNTTSEDLDNDTNSPKDDSTCKIANTTCNDIDYVHVRCSEAKKSNCPLPCDKRNSDANPNENQSLEGSNIDTTENELEHTLYEESQEHEANEKQINTTLPISTLIKTEEDKSSIVSMHCKVKEMPKRSSDSSVVSNDIYCTDDGLKPILYEQCCDFSDIDDCEKTSISLSRSCLQQIEKDFAQYSFERTDVPNKVGKCVKVYSHKRRKSTDDVKSKLVNMDNVIPKPPSTDCIDLLEEPSSNDIPVTLLTSLDMESAEYIISLSTENIQSIVGATMNEQHGLITCNDIKHIIDYDTQKENVNKKELSTENSDYIKPVLRRSLRLNHQESEDVNNTESTRDSTVTEKHFKKSYSPNRTELCSRAKRRAKDTDRKVPEHNFHNVQTTKKNCNNSRTHKNTPKLIVKKNTKSAGIVHHKEKEEHKVKPHSKPKCEVSEKNEMNTSVFVSAKLNTIEHINRALWGDMSDILEDCENIMDLSEYEPHTEIPFAVGLLPLRTALEKMQATPDYQPRKTRSSVAPIKQDTNGLKRKNCGSLDSAIISKKQNNNLSDPKENTNTVCHIQIRTAPSQYIRNRKKFLSTDVATLEAPSITNKQ